MFSSPGVEWHLSRGSDAGHGTPVKRNVRSTLLRQPQLKAFLQPLYAVLLALGLDPSWLGPIPVAVEAPEAPVRLLLSEAAFAVGQRLSPKLCSTRFEVVGPIPALENGADSRTLRAASTDPSRLPDCMRRTSYPRRWSSTGAPTVVTTLTFLCGLESVLLQENSRTA